MLDLAIFSRLTGKKIHVLFNKKALFVFDLNQELGRKLYIHKQENVYININALLGSLIIKDKPSEKVINTQTDNSSTIKSNKFLTNMFDYLLKKRKEFMERNNQYQIL